MVFAMLALIADGCAGPKSGQKEQSGLPDEGFDPLCVAIMQSDPELVERLIDAGANVNAAYTEEAVSALSYACGLKDKANAVHIAKLLLKAGADVNGRCTDRYYDNMPLLRAVEMHNVELVRLLTDNGSAFYVTHDQCGRAPVWEAADRDVVIGAMLAEWQLRPNRAISNDWTGSYSFNSQGDDYQITVKKDSCTFRLQPGPGSNSDLHILTTARTDGDTLRLFYLKKLGKTDFCNELRAKPLAIIVRKDGKYYAVGKEVAIPVVKK
jgi:ankyrin repeat protein